MPSIEFLDVLEWREHISEVCAVEVEPAVLQEMRLVWDQLPLNMKVQFKDGDILEFLRSTEECFDLYNLDFYGGFLFTRSQKPARVPDAIRAIVRRHGEKHIPCILICTFNVRDTGEDEYLRFLDELPQKLRGWKHIDESVKAHSEGHAQKMKACFPLFVLHECRKFDLQLTLADPFVYRSSALMLHFYMEALPRSVDLPRLMHEEDSMVNLLNLPLRQLEGLIPRMNFRPPIVARS